MKFPRAVDGRVLNSVYQGHVVRVEDDNASTGGFLIYQRWDGSDGPNGNGEFDDWVANEEALQSYFAEAGWVMQWGTS